MNAQTESSSYDPSTFDYAAYCGFCPPEGQTRYDGWIPEKRRRFLEALSEGIPISRACEIVGMSRQSAYALRESPRGLSFAIGWDAAVMRARNTLSDELFERALLGNRDTTTGDNGSITTRHRHDNRLGMAVLARLDRMADAQKGPGIAAAARLAASDFPQYLDLIERDAGPARTGMFLGARVEPAGEAALAPIRALARADHWLRTHTDIADPLATADLDPAERAGWTAEQWLRAEAVGLVALAPEQPAAPAEIDTRVSCQLRQPAPEEEPVWYYYLADEWRTSFPPPEDFDGEEDAHFGDEGYSRTLTEAELKAFTGMDEAGLAERAELAALQSRARDLYFGFTVPTEAELAAAAAAAEPPVEQPENPAPAANPAPPRALSAKTANSGAPGSDAMSIFGKIKDAIFGHPKAQAQTPAAPQNTAPAPQAQAPAPATPQAQPSDAPAEPVDVENVLMVFETERGSADLNWRTSIVDLMKLLGLDSSLENRKELATELGYTGATDGSAEMNIWLHKAVMEQLEKSGGKVPASLKD